MPDTVMVSCAFIVTLCSGEALSSICQLVSSFSVCTRTEDEEIGAFLEFDSSGKLAKQTQKARPVGTTVIIEELFKVRSLQPHIDRAQVLT